MTNRDACLEEQDPKSKIFQVSEDKNEYLGKCQSFSSGLEANIYHESWHHNTEDQREVKNGRKPVLLVDDLVLKNPESRCLWLFILKAFFLSSQKPEAL